VARGVEGFRRSHLRAQEAERLMRQWSSSWLCDYDEIAVVSLLIKDPQEARWVVQETLGDLYNADPWLAELRETLRLYLAFGRSRARVAEEIHVSRNTVAYRVQKVSKLLKRAIDEDPLRLRLALEIARVLPVESG
jgi:DNA-binding PucR family transcriptional regulator